MSKGVHFNQVSFVYDTSSHPLFLDLSCRFPGGWSGVVGPNGSGKTTLLKLAAGLLEPFSGNVQIPDTAVYCEQRTDEPPSSLEALIKDTGSGASKIKGSLGIESDWHMRWKTLSHGERKRVQIGVILWRPPDLLALDEPTNHLDREARAQLATALKTYRGTGLLVSHDRELLDALCVQCLFLNPPIARIYSGGFTKAAEVAKTEEEHLKNQLDKAKRARKKLEKEVARRRRAADQADRKRSKRGIKQRDHDAKEKIDRARASGKDGHAGRVYKQLQGRLGQARDKQSEINVKKEYALGIWMPGVMSRSNTLFEIEEGAIPLSKVTELCYPDLTMQPADRIAVTGPNGSGKSTLIKKIISTLKLSEDRLTYIPQEIEATRAGEILDHARKLPSEKLGLLMTVVSLLGSRPERLLESEIPSPGETRKLLLALGITHEPHLIIMDEPTNHMDLPSIECLEDALVGCPCGLLLVSHDWNFLKRLTRKQWQIKGEGSERFNLQIT